MTIRTLAVSLIVGRTIAFAGELPPMAGDLRLGLQAVVVMTNTTPNTLKGDSTRKILNAAQVNAYEDTLPVPCRYYTDQQIESLHSSLTKKESRRTLAIYAFRISDGRVYVCGEDKTWHLIEGSYFVLFARGPMEMVSFSPVPFKGKVEVSRLVIPSE
jgi:hypothetical protein